MGPVQSSRINFGMIVLGFFIAIAYVPGWTGASVSTTWFLLMLVMPILIWPYHIRVTSAHIWGGLFLSYALLSLCWSIRFNFALFGFVQLLVCGVIFAYGSVLIKLDDVLKGLAIGLGVSSVLIILQKFGIDTQITGIYTFDGGRNQAGLFVNENVLCEISVILCISLLVFRLYWPVLFTLPAIVLVHSRGAMVGLLVGLVCLTKQKWLLLVGIGAAFLIYQFGYFNVSSIQERLNIWRDTLNSLSLWGHGIGSYEIGYPENAKYIDVIAQRPRYAHNEYLHFAYELGIGALLLIPFVCSLLKFKGDAKIILYTIGIIAFFGFPLHIPMFAFIACLVAGYITRYDVAVSSVGDYRGLHLPKRRAF